MTAVRCHRRRGEETTPTTRDICHFSAAVMAATAALLLACLSAALWRTSGELLTPPSESARLNSTSSGGVAGTRNDTAAAARISPLMAHLPALKNIVIFIFVLTAALITCLVIKVVRYGPEPHEPRSNQLMGLFWRMRSGIKATKTSSFDQIKIIYVTLQH